MKKLFSTSTYFRKMLTMCLLVISVTIFVLSVFFYQKYTQALTRKLYADQEKNLEKAAQTMKDVYSEISQLYNTVIMDSKVVDYSTLTAFDPAKNYATYLVVKKIYNINPYVSSLYIYNSAADDAITCGSYEFDLQSAWDRLKGTKKASVFPLPLLDSGKSVLTFAYPLYADTYSELSGGVFFNLDMEALRDHVLGTGPESGFILDENRQVLMSDADKLFTDQKELDSLRDWAGRLSGQSGSTLMELSGRHYLCAAYREPVHGLLFLCSTPYSEIVRPMRNQRNLYLLVAFFIFLGAIFLQYMITRKLYRPLEELTETLRDSKYAQSPQMDEFSLIRHVYEKALDEIQMLELEQAKYQPKVRADLLKGLILGTQEAGHIHETLKNRNWDIPFQGMFLSCFLIDTFEDGELLAPVTQTRIQQLLYETLEKQLYLECVAIGSDQIVCLINTIKDSPVTFDDLIGLIDQAKEQIIRQLKVTLTISLDGIIMKPGDCCLVYRKAMELTNYRFVFGYNQIIDPRRIMELLPESMTYPDKLAGEILSSMSEGKRQEFEEQLSKFTEILRQYSYQPASLLFNRLYLDILFQMQKLSAPDKTTYMPSEPLRFPNTLDEGAGMLLSIYDQYQDRKTAAALLKDNRHFERIEESKRYIEAHFNDYNLSAAAAADYLGYSTNYFSRIFKSITGFYINDYIRQIRIVKAQQMLVESDMTITAIAAATGFANPNYFYSIFKKETGLTPAAYRSASQPAPDQ